MDLCKALLLAPAALGLLSPLAAKAAPNIASLDKYAAADEQVTSISQFSDVKPTDWAYQALSNLIEKYGCVAGYPNGTDKGGQAMTRYEAAALLNACLDRVTEVTDELKTLMKEFEKELAVLKGRVDGLEGRIGLQESKQFSTTTKLKGIATFVFGANSFSGSAMVAVAQSQASAGATTFNNDIQLMLDTSFTGQDLLRTSLRSGNFGHSSFGDGGPSSLSQLADAFEETCADTASGLAVNCGNVVYIDKIYYQVPLGGGFTATLGGRVGQDDMLAVWPSVYPGASVLDVLTLAGAPAAYNELIGTGAGLWWQGAQGLSISANYMVANGTIGNPGSGGIITANAGSAATVQVAYNKNDWAIAAVYSSIQNGNGVMTYGTNFTLASFAIPGQTQAFGLSGYWQPTTSGWLPSISAGWGFNSTSYSHGAPIGSVLNSQSWSVGIQWSRGLAKGHQVGMAIGQPTFATTLEGGNTPNDGNIVWEWWYNLQISDHISITPALFYLSRPLGALTPEGTSFNQLGALLKTSFNF